MTARSRATTLCLLLCLTFSVAVCADLPPDAEFGGITYPAKGNIQLDEGTLDIWVISDFDTDYELDKSGADRNWRACLFDLVFPDEKTHYILHYVSWAHAFAMVGYGDPPQPYVWGGPNHWKPGEAHHVVFTWSGPKRSIFIDGVCEWKGEKGPNVAHDVDVEGDIKGDLSTALIQIGGNYSHLTVDEIQIRCIALMPDEIMKAKDAPLTADADTLLLDHCDGDKPEVIQAENVGEILSGAYEVVEGKFGKALRLWKEKK